MTFMNNTANIKQFKLIEFISRNCSDDYLVSKISITLRRDKIEAPYYMITKIRMSSCIDNPDKGIIHAMDILNHQRKYNLTEDKYNEIKSLITDMDDNCSKSDQVKILRKDNELKVILMSKNDDEAKNLFKDYHGLFDKIDNLID